MQKNEKTEESKEVQEALISLPRGTRVLERELLPLWEGAVCAVIPEGVEEIGFEAFAFCGALAAIRFPSTLKRIGKSAFQECVNLREVCFPEGLSEIGDCAFLNCLSLKKPDLPEGVKVGELAFHHVK